jgi:hypothetical protein
MVTTPGQLLDGYGTYLLYSTIKAHLSGKYNMVRYGVMKLKRSSYDVRKDRYFFEKVAKKYRDSETLRNFFISQFVDRSVTLWVGDMVTPEAEKVFRASEFRKGNTYLFGNELHAINDAMVRTGKTLGQFLVGNGQEAPPILSLLWNKEVSYDTFVVLYRMFSLSNKYTNVAQFDVMWELHSTLLHNYASIYPSYDERYPRLKEAMTKIWPPK